VGEFIEDELRSGILEKPFESSSSKDGAYYLSMPTAKPVGESLQLFSDWLFKETSATTTRQF